jgi:polysaccharide biosynthesis protein PslH
MNILMITTRLPFPANNGAKIRAFQILKALARVHRVTLVSYFGSERERGFFEVFSDLGVNLVAIHKPAIDRPVGKNELVTSLTTGLPLSVGKYNDPRLEQAIAAHVEGQDVILCEHMHIAHYAFRYPQLPRVLDAHNVETQIACRLTKCEPNILKKTLLSLNSKAMRSYERKVCNSFDMVLSVSPQDKVSLESAFAARSVKLLENGVDVSYFHPAATAGKNGNKKIVFVGAMDWLPNSDGIIKFVAESLPLIKKEYPGVQLDIVGKDPPGSVLKLGEVEGVRVTGTVDDVRPYVWGADVFIVPLRFGGGSRLKILEGFSMEIPVVSTTVGCEGINCHHERELLIADSAEQFSAAVVRALGEKDLGLRLTRNARELVEKTYKWETVCGKLIGYFDELGAVSGISPVGLATTE